MVHCLPAPVFPPSPEPHSMSSRRRCSRLALYRLEDRLNPTAPVAPVIIEPFNENQITGTFDINIQTDPSQYFDADGHAWAATDWKIRETASQATVWQLP